MVLSLLPLLYNRDNLTLTLHQKKIRFKAGNLPRMINKEWLAQFIYKPTKSTEKLAIENGHEKFGHDKIGNLILLFQIVNYHPVLSNNCNNVFLQR